MVASEKLPLWIERVLVPSAHDITIGENQTISAHWAQHYFHHGYGATVAEAMDLFHEDLMRTPGFESDYRSTIGPVALAAALPHPYSHELIFPHLRAGQKSQKVVTKYTSDIEFYYGGNIPTTFIYDPRVEQTVDDSALSDIGTGDPMGVTRVQRQRDISDLGLGYAQDPAIGGYTYDPATGLITGSDPAADIYIEDYKIGQQTTYTLTREQQGLPPIKEKAMPMDGPLSVTSLDFGYGSGAYSIPSMAPGYTRPRRAASQRVSVGKNIPRSKTMAKLNKYMHEWRKEIRQITGRLGGFYGPARPSRRGKVGGRHRHKINSFDYQRQGRTVHSHRVKSKRRRR